MFDKIRKHFGKEPGAVQQSSYDQKADPMKQMLGDLAKVIKNGIETNKKVDSNQSYEFIVRNLGKGDATHLRSIEGEEVQKVIEKIEAWCADKSPSEIPLKPKEIEALQQIVAAIENKELVIRQGGSLFPVKGTQIYNSLMTEQATIEKAGKLGVEKILKKDKEGNVYLAEGEKADFESAIYDVLEEGVSMEDAFGKDAVFDDEEYSLEHEEYSKEDFSKLELESFSEEFMEESERFSSAYSDLGRTLRQLYASKFEKLERKDAKESSRRGDTESLGEDKSAGNDHARKVREQNLLREAQKAHARSKKLFLIEERQKDREARVERDEIKELVKDLDDKSERIKREHNDFEIRQENAEES